MSFDIKLFCHKNIKDKDIAEPEHLVVPGDVISTEKSFMRGHGTFLNGENGHLCSAVAGTIEQQNKLIRVLPAKCRYNGEVGDLAVGRIVEVSKDRWKVETASRLHSTLLLNSVNLPGGELRRRSEEDEKMMRSYLSEGDLISAEVQQVWVDGTLSLHTRSLRYGKLGQGVLVQVPSSLIKRCKTHFHNLPCGATVIFGHNGYIWLCPTISDASEVTGGFVQNVQPVQKSDREVIARLRNCIVALAQRGMLLYDTSVLHAFEASLKYQVRELLRPAIYNEVCDLTWQKLADES